MVFVSPGLGKAVLAVFVFLTLVIGVDGSKYLSFLGSDGIPGYSRLAHSCRAHTVSHEPALHSHKRIRICSQ